MEMISSYNHIRNIFVNIDTDPLEVFFDLSDPPLIFRVESRHSRYNGAYVIRHRTASLGFVPVDVYGKSNVVRITFQDSRVAGEIISRIHQRCSEKPIHYGNFRSIRKQCPLLIAPNLSHFGCIYLITAILKRNFTMAAQASSDPLAGFAQLQKLSSENGDCLEKALILVLAAIDSGKVIHYWHAIEKQYHYYVANKDEISYGHYVVPEKCRMIRRVTVTPTRQLMWAPEIMCGNRILRRFDSEYALRVSFRDDNNSRLSFNAAYADQDIFSLAIKNPMSSGISVGERCYEFLAWSNSQIRDHGVWMYARDDKGNTIRDIRRFMGDFSHIHSVPKYMARMGQSFSQTEDTISVPLDPRYVRTENDIEGGFDPMNKKPYCFSDGVGKISSKLAKEVQKALGHDQLCSAFQIRYGGCKGMLVIDPTLTDADIVIRKSMEKFKSPENFKLEIARTSAPIGLQLNRPFITVLNDMGVRHRTFLKLQEEVLRNLTDILFNEKKAAAFLESKTPNQIFSYKDLSKSGVYLTTEPFFRSLLLALHRHHVEKIKSRANIAIDPSQGRNMLGVMDETGKLNYGEVFVQYTKDISYGETTKNTEILKRVVLVTKSPCLLPGDVRKFKAVDIPELHHIVDCIVFPQKGPRPHPTEMAGSDLDGDEYTVLWNDDLIFHASNHPPGHFPSSPETMVINIQDTHMIDFLVTYIKNDQVGSIANAHLAHASNGDIFSAQCLAIAKKFSVAVDFAKTGSSQHLVPSERPKEFPDFMEKDHKENYKSKKALGKMYRVAHDYESENEHASIAYHGIHADPDLKYPGWETYQPDAIKSRNRYNTLLKTVLRNYGIQHEAEVFSGAFTNLYCRFQERKDRDEIEKVVVRCIKRLTKSMHEEFMDEFSKLGDAKELDARMLQKASAWYQVTYGDAEAKFLSFPWAVSKILANIKIRKMPLNPMYFSPIVCKMDDQIQSCDSKNLLPSVTDSDMWSQYESVCDQGIVKVALQVMVLWGREDGVLDKPGGHPGFIDLYTFKRLFFHIAEGANYVANRRSTKHVAVDKGKHFSAASLCLEFFSFCLTLRFYNKYEVQELIPFSVRKYSALSKRAVVAYHTFALLGKFQSLYFEESYVTKNNIQMKTIQIESKIFVSTPISEASLQKAQDALIKYSGVENVTLREIQQTKKVVVSADGTEQSLKDLKSILRKKQVFIRELFTTGVLPAA